MFKSKKIDWFKPTYNTCRVFAKSGKIYGLFYDSKSKLRHVSEFSPSKNTPHITLCGNRNVNFCATGDTDHICSICEERLMLIPLIGSYHNHIFKRIINPILTKFGWIIVSCFDKEDKFIGFKFKTYPEHCRGPFNVWYKLRIGKEC